MANYNALSMQGAKVIATANKTRMANSVVHLFKQGLNPFPTTSKADFLAAEADFDGYAPATVAAWGDPVLMGQGWATYAPSQTFRWVFGTAGVGNVIGGYFIVDSAGNLMLYGVFDPATPISGDGQAIIITPIQFTPAG